ncbi:MAG: hypothetical protein GF346_07780 [Candidatus Eisenbacteria bacterium]|nr:hypothetical protein [Candidatus Latescibacterota bacterium]MBD3302332.1 hypothetical protein [Candidatus Eisenbacteria bacterium]
MLRKTGTSRHGARRASWLPWIAVACLATSVDCSRDLHEWTGPLVPLPNLTGRVLRAGEPVVDEKVELLETSTDTLITDDRTDGEGSYRFAEVGAGDWTVEVDSDDPRDFDKAAYEIRFTSDDTILALPDMDLALGGVEAREPEPDASVALPRFSVPLRFVWSPPDDRSRTIQVRLYADSGEPVWYSPELQGETELLWNGIGNRGDASGRPVAPGTFRWRLRVENGTGLELSTSYRDVSFREESR